MYNRKHGYVSIIITFAVVMVILFGGLVFYMQKDIESIENIPASENNSAWYYRLNPDEALKRANEIQGEVEERNANIEEFYREEEGIDINTGEYVGFPPDSTLTPE